MTDINIDDFFKDGAKALALLYSAFPRRQAVYVEDICGPDEPDEFGMHGSRYLACFSTLLWLAEEGYLRFKDSIRQDAIDEAVLTSRCFTLLSSRSKDQPLDDGCDLPESVRAERSLTISRIRGALKQRSSTEIRDVMLDLMTHMNTPAP